jgi:plastocyanin
MNKFLIIIIILVVILSGGVVYKQFFVAEDSKPSVTGEVKDYTIVARKNQWRFDPEVIEAEKGDRVNLTLINEDDYDHGITIEAFGINQRLAAGETTHISFVVTQEGEFPFFCSVPCGEGEVDGHKRGHFDQIGKMVVRGVVKQTTE